MSTSARERRDAIRDLIRNRPAIALVAGLILGPPPGLAPPLGALEAKLDTARETNDRGEG